MSRSFTTSAAIGRPAPAPALAAIPGADFPEPAAAPLWPLEATALALLAVLSGMSLGALAGLVSAWLVALAWRQTQESAGERAWRGRLEALSDLADITLPPGDPTLQALRRSRTLLARLIRQGALRAGGRRPPQRLAVERLARRCQDLEEQLVRRARPGCLHRPAQGPAPLAPLAARSRSRRAVYGGRRPRGFLPR